MMQSAATLKCKSRTWEINNSASDPTLKHEQVLQVSAGSCDFDLYVHDPANPYAQTDRAPLAAFSSNGKILRIGSRIFERDSSSDRFTPVPDIHSEGSHLASRKARYVEEVSRHDHTLAVTSRMKLSNQDVDCLLEDIHDYELDSQHFDSGEGTDGSDNDTENSDSDSDDRSDYSKDKKFASDDDSVSEGSSIASIKDRFEDDEIAPWDDPEAGYSDDSKSGDECSDDDELAVETDSSDSEEEGRKPPPPRNPRSQLAEEEDEDEEDEEDIRRYFRDQRPVSHSKPRATISVFDTNYGESTLLFSKQVRLKCKLWASPPVFHPSKPLLVWPLGDGQILFVDYDRGSSFTRTLRPSTPLSEFDSLACLFTPDVDKSVFFFASD
jgi:hypothetical protein